MPFTATAQELVRAGEFRALPIPKIVETMLPNEHLPIARISFEIPTDPERLAMPGLTVRSVRFYTASVPISADFCMQDEIVTETTPIPVDDRAWLEAPPGVIREISRARLYRYRSDGAPCDGARPHFDIYGMPPSNAFEAIRALARARQQMIKWQGSSRRFSISCNGWLMGPCTARRAMTLFDMGGIVGISIDPQPEPGLRKRMRAPGDQLIEYHLPLVGHRRTSLHAVVNRGRVIHLEIAEDNVVF